uniref:Reverse transcriptase Ty1/copia-type domain-containing protein n=1 Tax=Tanacetum cinerariifolium TaxID=118510 RepID=A0A6L2KIS1_TANCI|nr:hypothetical protein [Tanacetum cinerariifolium]
MNRVLVVKPHNKTHYELFRGRTPALSFMRPCGCHVTILKTLDYLGKFNGKSDEGFFVGFSLNSARPKWLFDIDVLTKSINYVPVLAGTNSNDFVDGSLFDSSSKNASNDEPQPSSDAGKKDDEVSTATPEATHADFFGDESEVDVSNITATYQVPSTLNTRIHKDHLLDHIYRNKKDKRGIVVRNKERLVAQGHTQEEGLDYDEAFAPVARIKAIKLFLAYASFKDFVVYQMDVKSAFQYGKIKDEVYVYQPPGFLDPEFPDRVYKVEKTLYGLHQAPRACHDKYVDEILKKFGFSNVKTASTPMETSNPLLKDENAEAVDVYLYRSMIGSLMYLTSSRPNIMFVVCACVRFQVTSKVLDLHAVKRIFRYLKGQPKLGLLYPKDSPFDLEAYTDSDYASASLDRKSTTGCCQFLRIRLIS